MDKIGLKPQKQLKKEILVDLFNILYYIQLEDRGKININWSKQLIRSPQASTQSKGNSQYYVVWKIYAQQKYFT